MTLRPAALAPATKRDQRDTPEPRASLFLMTSQLNVGGTERQFVVLANALQEQYRVHLGCLQRAGAFLTEIGAIEEFPLGGSYLAAPAWQSRRALWRRLRGSGIEVAQSFDFYANLMLIPVARAAGVPVVLGSFRSLGDRLSPLQFAVLAATFRLCDRVVCNSRAAAAKLAEDGLPAKLLTVIPNALLPAVFERTPPALAPVRGGLRAGMIGRMNEKVKNQETFLRACAVLGRQFPQAEFVLAGDGALRAQYERLARSLGIAPRVRFLGERRDVQAVLASLDVAVIPSLSESLSNVVLESMAAGKAVVASRVGGNPEVLQDGVTGRLFASEDHEECARAMADLLSAPAMRMEMGRRARAYAEENFSLQRVCRRYEQEYGDLLERKRRKKLWGVGMSRAESNRARLSVALIAPSTRTLGGQAVQADLLLRHWREDEEVEAAFVPVDPTFPVGLRWIERIPFLRTVVRLPFYLNAVWRALNRADVAHLFSASYWSFLLAPAPALLLARWRGKATVLNYRSGEARDHLQNWRTAAPILRRADRLVVPSGYLRDVFAEFDLQAEVVPNVVDLRQFAFRERRPLQARLVCTRGFEPYYDVDLVVRAFAEVKGRFREAQLCLVGGGRLEGKVREVARELRLGSEVEFTGPVPRDRIGEHYARNDIFINASWLDNMPVSLLEAFASGTPVVTTAPEGIRYIVEHERTGLLCEPKDWRGLAENALRLLREPDFARTLARNAYEESKGYRWEAVRERWLGVYQSVCLPWGAGSSAKENRAAAEVRAQ